MNDPTLDLPAFLPYQLSVAANRVSNRLARIYADRFDLTIPEWRVMAVLGRFPGLSAMEVAERTAMDKVRVSRAVARLLRAGRLERQTDPTDRRRTELRLSEGGRAIYAEIVPLARGFERSVAAELAPEELAALRRALGKLLAAD